MGSGSRTPKMRRLDGRKKKIARIKRRIAAAKAAAPVVHVSRSGSKKA